LLREKKESKGGTQKNIQAGGGRRKKKFLLIILGREGEEKVHQVTFGGEVQCLTEQRGNRRSKF